MACLGAEFSRPTTGYLHIDGINEAMRAHLQLFKPISRQIFSWDHSCLAGWAIRVLGYVRHLQGLVYSRTSSSPMAVCSTLQKGPNGAAIMAP